MTQTDQELDRIERSIDIDASAEKVWSLIAAAGLVDQRARRRPRPGASAGRATTWRRGPRRSSASSRSCRSSPTRPATSSYRWVDNVAPEAGTTVEFWIEERPGGVTLRVVESGFTGLGKDADALATRSRSNSHGWEAELEAAKRFVLGTAGTSA